MALQDVDLAFALQLPPVDAIDYFNSKGVQTTWNWWEAAGEFSERAFTSAKITRLDILMDVRDAIDNALQDGVPNAEFRANIEQQLTAKGWLASTLPAGAPSLARWETIYRTNMQAAYNGSRFQFFQENKANKPYLQYRAVPDSRVRPAHLALHRFTARADDPVWQVITAPNGYNCRCTITALSAKQVRDRGIKVEKGDDFRVASVPVNNQPNAPKVRAVRFERNGQTMTLDPGFANNPGIKWYEPDLKRYPPALVRRFRSHQQGDTLN